MFDHFRYYTGEGNTAAETAMEAENTAPVTQQVCFIVNIKTKFCRPRHNCKHIYNVVYIFFITSMINLHLCIYPCVFWLD